MPASSAVVKLSDPVRKLWKIERKRHLDGRRSVVTIVGPEAGRAALALAALTDAQVTVFPADGVRTVKDWYSIEVRTSFEGLPDGTEVTRSGTCRIRSFVPEALTRSGDHILVIHGIDRVPPDALNGLRGALDDSHPQVPPFGPPVSSQTQIVLTAEKLSRDSADVLIERLGTVIRID